ncbi:spectrin beta chain [Schistosoma japonicum]|nr:spectrin beta chain [Schistosoma japonicum]
MLTDYLDDIIEPNEDTQHDLNSNKKRERLSTVDQQTIVIDVLTEQKSLTVDKQIVINSTSRQMDHHDNHSITLIANRFVANIYEPPPPTIKHNSLLPINQDQPVTDSNNKLKLITLESLQPVLEYHR